MTAGVRLVRARVQSHGASRSPASAPSWPSATRWTSADDITKTHAASFEPVLDYVWSRCHGSRSRSSHGGLRLHDADESVGEAMAIGRTFKRRFKRGSGAGDRPARLGWSGVSRDGSPDQRQPGGLRVAPADADAEASSRSSAPARRGLGDEVAQASGVDPGFPVSDGRLLERALVAHSPRGETGAATAPHEAHGLLGRAARALRGSPAGGREPVGSACTR